MPQYDETLPAKPNTLFGSELEPGAQVGPYVVEERGRRGGFATVYRARHYRDDGPAYALKLLHESLCRSSKMLLRFEREIEMLRRARHPNIVEVIDCGALPDGRSYYVMPWIDGTPLDDLLASRGAFGVDEVLAMCEQLADALRVAHGLGMVHRDLKPANMVVRAGGGMCLLDFGIAKVVSDDATGRHDLTSTGAYVGTPHYMAPEQITGDPVDARTDVYALGVMLYQLVTGQLPFTAPTPLEVELHHLNTPPPRPSDHASVPRGFDEVVARCLAKAPGERYRSVDELVTALHGTLAPRADAEAIREHLAIGLHVDVSPASDADEALDAVDDAIDRARDACAGLSLLSCGARSFVAVLPPGRDASSAAELAFTIARCAGDLARVAVTLHRASAVVDDDELTGGDLARVADWLAPAHEGVWVTDAIRGELGLAGGEHHTRLTATADSTRTR